MKPEKRQKVKIDPVYLRTRAQVDYLFKILPNLPLDPINPVEVIIREQVKKRKLSMNAAMWAGPLKDIEEKGWYQGRQYCAEVWHEHFKEAFLPDENDPDFDPSHVVEPESYRKWDFNPWNGNRVLVGSTTQLTDPGMRFYLLQMEAEAASEYGVSFNARHEDFDPQWRQSA